MAKNLFKDFDKMLSEVRADTITVRVFGEDYTISAIMPAYVPVMLSRYEDDLNKQGEVLREAAILMFGAEAVMTWMKHPTFSHAHLNTIMVEVFSMINGRPEDEYEEITEDDTGKPPKK